MQIDFVDSGKRELDEFIDGEYLFLDTPTMENIDDDTQCGSGQAEGVSNTSTVRQSPTGEEKVHVRVCLPNDQHNSQSLHDGTLTGPQDCQIGSSGTPSVIDQTQSINPGDNSVRPVSILPAYGENVNGSNERSGDRTDGDYVDYCLNQMSPGTWSQEVAAKLNSLRQEDIGIPRENTAEPITTQTDVRDSDFSEKFVKDVAQEECAQCLEVGTDIGDRHYYTHVRSIIICDDEPLAEVEAAQPRVVDTYTDCHAYQLSLWQNKNSQQKINFKGKLPYWTTPYYLMGLLMHMKHRLTKAFPFRLLNNTRYTWKATPILIAYKSKDGKHASIAPGNIFKNDAKALPEPAHEQIHMISKPTCWFGASMDIWIHVEIKQLSYPQEIVTSAEDRFLSKIRELMTGKDNPYDTMTKIIKEFTLLKDSTNTRSYPIQDSSTNNPNSNSTDQTETLQEAIRKTSMRHAAIKRAINHRLAKINELSTSRNGSQRLHSSLEEENLSQAQLQQKRKDTLWRNRQLVKTSPNFQVVKKQKIQTTTSVNTAKEPLWKKLTPYSKSSKPRSQEEKKEKPSQSSNPFGVTLNKESQVEWLKDQARIRYSNHDSNADIQRKLQQWNPDKAILRVQQERMREIKSYPQEDQLFYLNRITNPHPNLIPALESEKRHLEWIADRNREAGHHTQTAHFYDWPEESPKSRYKSYKNNLADLRSRMQKH